MFSQFCRYYCDYCDTYLTHDSVSNSLVVISYAISLCRSSNTFYHTIIITPLQVVTKGNFIKFQPSVRKTHCSGRKHKENVRDYYQHWLEDQVQKLVDDTSETIC